MRRVSLDGGGKLPPQDIELEYAVLGAIMLDKNVVDAALELLVPECFYKDSNSLVFKSIVKLAKDKSPVDILTVTAQLKKDGNLDSVGGAFAVAQLTNNVASTANVEFHSRIIVEKYLAREVIRIAGEFQSKAYNDEEDVFETLDELYKQIDTIRNFGVSDNDAPFAMQVDERVKEKEKMVADGIKFTGISTGNTSLDKVLGGFVKQNLVIVAARPGMGKSVKGLDYAKECAVQGKTAVVFSLEMSSQELIDRFLVTQAQIPLHHYRSNELHHYQVDQIKTAGKALKSLPIVISDKPSINCNHIRRKVKSVIKSHGNLGLIVVDYLQLMTSTEKLNNREQEVSSVSRGLKAIAKEFDVPVIALVQVGRGAEQSKDKRPELSHLRESGSIESDADVVMFIYRPRYYFDYGKHPDDIYSMDNITESDYETLSELLIAKNRNGIPNAMVKEKFLGAFSTFKEHGHTESADPFAITAPDFMAIASKLTDNTDLAPAPF